MDLNRLTSSHLISCHTSLLSRIEFTLDPTRSYNDRVGFSSTYSAIGTEGHEVGMAHDSFLDSLHGSPRLFLRFRHRNLSEWLIG